MKAWYAREFSSDPDVAELREVPDPGEPGPGQVLISVGAAGIALPDLLLLLGAYPGMDRTLPHPIGLEYAGTVTAAGEDVGTVEEGDRVCGTVYAPQGAASEALIVDATDVARLPDRLSLVQGAAVPSAYMTAYDALHRHGSLREGERVLVLAAASGLGLACVQLARLAGAEVHGAASAGKLDAVRAAGASEAHDYRTDGWDRGLPEFDVVVDVIGGASFARSYDLLAPGGRLVCVGAISRYPEPGRSEYLSEPTDPKFDPIDLIRDAKSVVGINMPSLWDGDGGQAPLLGAALSYFDDTDARPAIARTFPFEDAADALRFVQDRRNIGRVVLNVSASEDESDAELDQGGQS